MSNYDNYTRDEMDGVFEFTSEPLYTIESFDIVLLGDSSVGLPDKVINWKLPEPVEGTKEEIEEACDDVLALLSALYGTDMSDFHVTTAELERLQVEAENKLDMLQSSILDLKKVKS